MKKGRQTREKIEDLLYPVNGYRGKLAQKGVAPKDHTKDNMQVIKKKHEDFVQKQETLAENKKESNWKMKKFQKVTSVVTPSIREHQDKYKDDPRLARPSSVKAPVKPLKASSSATKLTQQSARPIAKPAQPAVRDKKQDPKPRGPAAAAKPPLPLPKANPKGKAGTGSKQGPVPLVERFGNEWHRQKIT